MSKIQRSCTTSSISDLKLESKGLLHEFDCLALFSQFKGVDEVTDGESFNLFKMVIL